MQATHRLDAIFAALADPPGGDHRRLASGQRRERAGPAVRDEPARDLEASFKVLERAGLISRGREAQRRPRRLGPGPAEADKWLERYRQLWKVNYQRLDTLLDELKARKESLNENALKITPSGDRDLVMTRDSMPRARSSTTPHTKPDVGQAVVASARPLVDAGV